MDTLIKYLVDSLQSYESGHGDALCPTPREADKSFMGDHLLVQPVTTDEFRTFSVAVMAAIRESKAMTAPQLPSSSPCFLARTIQPQVDTNRSLSPVTNANREFQRDTIADRDLTVPWQYSVTSVPFDGPAPLSSNPVPIAGVYIPDLGRKKGTWRIAVRQWEEPDSNIQLALKDWPEEWYTGRMKNKTAAKRSQRKLIAMEYKR